MRRPRYFFHIHDGKNIEDHDGVECAGPDEARTQAIRAAGEILRDQSHQPWLGNAWQMRVEEDGGRAVCRLTVTVEQTRPNDSPWPIKSRRALFAKVVSDSCRRGLSAGDRLPFARRQGALMPNPLISKLRHGASLDDGDVAKLEKVCQERRRLGARQGIICEGDEPSAVHLVLDGVACRYKLLPDGQRSIVALLLPGDFCDLHVAILGNMDHAIATVSSCTVVDIPRSTIEELTRHSSLTQALWWATLVDEGVLREWLVNMGKRTATKRAAHLFCEVHARLRAIALAEPNSCELPLTQQELGEVLGLSTVHVNRTLQTLREAQLVEFRDGRLTIRDLADLQRFAEFDANYLHLNMAAEGAA